MWSGQKKIFKPFCPFFRNQVQPTYDNLIFERGLSQLSYDSDYPVCPFDKETQLNATLLQFLNT